MNLAMQVFINYLTEKGYRYSILSESRVEVQIQNINIILTFGTSCRDVCIKTKISKIPHEKIENAYLLCSRLNTETWFISYYIDSENNLVAKIDAILTQPIIGQKCLFLVLSMFSLIDNFYPEIMKMIWS